jgi:hypothetical protein
MALQDVISGGNGDAPPANPSIEATVTGSNPQTGTNPPEKGDGGGTGGAKLAAWTQQVSKDIRENPELAGKLAAFEKLDDLAKSYFELEKKSGIPGKDAKPEEVSAFWKKLGYPDKPEDYRVSKEDQNASTFVSAAHAARLTDDQASTLWKQVSEGTRQRETALREAQNKEIADTDAALKRELGDRYEEAATLFKRGVGDGKILEALRRAGLAGKMEIVRAFIALGEMTRESGSPRSDIFSGEKDYMNGAWDFSPGKTK